MSEDSERHLLVSEIKRLASELGRTPSRDEFRQLIGASSRSPERLFGGFTALVQAAGLAPLRQKKVTNAIFERPIIETLKVYQELQGPRAIMLPDDFEPMLVIGDAHFPFAHVDTLSAIYQFAEMYQPKHVIQMGDLYDLYAHSKFPKSLNIYTPKQEIEFGQQMASSMWSNLRKICKGAKSYQLMGNHDVRPVKRVLEKAPELEQFVKLGIKPFFQFDGVQTIEDYRQELILQNILFHHGYKSRLGDHLLFNQMNTVGAHTHRGGTLFKPYKNQILFEANAGYIGDEKSKALGYTPQQTTNWTRGFLWIDSWGPRFISC